REHTNKKEKNYKNVKNDKNGKNEKESVVVGVIGPAGNFIEICQKYMDIFGTPLTSTFQQALQGYLDKGLTEELIVLAIEEAGFQDKRTFSYLKGILNNWYNDGIRTVDQAKNMMAEHEQKKKSNKNKGKGRDKYDDKESSGLTEGEEDLYRKLFG
ncbi:MAG: DnaD domain protein, partial [Halarsenatibacteraceae bacterium]